MTALYIILGIIAFIIILLHLPFNIYVSCCDNKISVKLRYIFLKKYIYPQFKKKIKETKLPESNQDTETEKTAKSNDNKNKKNVKKEKTEKKKKKSLFPEAKDEKISFIINIMKSSGKALRHFTKRIYVKKLKVNIDISDEDACDCAVKFGKTNIAVYNILSFISVFFRVKKEYININCVYNKPESIYNFSFVIKFTPSAGILSAIVFIFTLLVNNKNVSAKTAESKT